MLRLKKSSEEVINMVKLAIQKGYRQIKVSETNPNEILLRIPGTINITSLEFLNDKEIKYSCFEGYSFKCILETDANKVKEFLEGIYSKSNIVNGDIKEIPANLVVV